MVLQVGGFGERQAADVAFEVLFAGVQALVRPQRRVAAERPCKDGRKNSYTSC